jgi:hypothetical protein
MSIGVQVAISSLDKDYGHKRSTGELNSSNASNNTTECLGLSGEKTIKCGSGFPGTCPPNRWCLFPPSRRHQSRHFPRFIRI